MMEKGGPRPKGFDIRQQDRQGSRDQPDLAFANPVPLFLPPQCSEVAKRCCWATEWHHSRASREGQCCQPSRRIARGDKPFS